VTVTYQNLVLALLDLELVAIINTPRLIIRIFESLQLLFPENKVWLVSRKEFHATDVSIYSNHLEKLLGWTAKNGSKFTQNVSVPEWIKEKREL